MQSFVSDLLDLQKIKDGEFRQANAPFILANTFDMVCRMFMPSAELSGVSLSWHYVRKFEHLQPNIGNPADRKNQIKFMP